MNIIEPRPMSLCISVDYCRGYNDAARKANQNTNLIDAEAFKKFIENLGKEYGNTIKIENVMILLDDFVNMDESELNDFYFS